jgi:hypothetical protein
MRRAHGSCTLVVPIAKRLQARNRPLERSVRRRLFAGRRLRTGDENGRKRSGRDSRWRVRLRSPACGLPWRLLRERKSRGHDAARSHRVDRQAVDVGESTPMIVRICSILPMGAVGCVRTGSDFSSPPSAAGRVRTADIDPRQPPWAAFRLPVVIVRLERGLGRACTFVESKGERQRSDMTDRRHSRGPHGDR